MNTDILARHLADRFTKHLRKYVGDENMKEIARLNQKEGGNHEHDFCDANQAMIDAWQELWPDVEMDAASGEHADLINEAWGIAKKSWQK